jgi:hypothetical protein
VLTPFLRTSLPAEHAEQLGSSSALEEWHTPHCPRFDCISAIALNYAQVYMDITETYDMHTGGLPRFALFKDGVLGRRRRRRRLPLPLLLRPQPRHCAHRALRGTALTVAALCVATCISRPVEEEYPALKTKKARTAQGIFDYMSKMEGGR